VSSKTHSLVIEGIYYQEDDRQQIRFRRLPPPADAEAARVTACIVKKIIDC
jgi:hypothetical protein